MPVEEKYRQIKHHRKGIGLNHFAIAVSTRDIVVNFSEIRFEIKSLMGLWPQFKH
jgi:hypothetical protein